MRHKKIKRIICLLVIMGNFLGMLDSSTVNLALYPIAQGLNITLTEVQWVVIAYMLVLTVFLPFFGKLGDIFSKNKVYGSGFLIFAIGALLNCTAPNFYTLLIFRCIEALGASIMIANGPAVIATLFKGEKRGQALGLNASLVAVGGMTGPAVGGALINFLGWRAIFLPSVPLAIIGAYLAFKLRSEERR